MDIILVHVYSRVGLAARREEIDHCIIRYTIDLSLFFRIFEFCITFYIALIRTLILSLSRLFLSPQLVILSPQNTLFSAYSHHRSILYTIMKFSSAFSSSSTTTIILLLAASSVSAFAPSRPSSSMIQSSTSTSSSSALNIVVGDTAEAFADRVKSIFRTIVKSTDKSQKFDNIVQSNFPGAITNQELVQNAVSLLSKKGYDGENTLLATSLCCDELARKLEDDFNGIYGKNFNLGGLGTLYIRSSNN
jgi:hypothetical protein